MMRVMAAPWKYSVELQQQTTRMAMDARKDPESARGAIKRVADQLGVHPEALRNWVRQAEIDGGVRPGTTTDDAQRLAETEAVASVGSKGDSYDNAMAEALNSLFKAEYIRNPVTRPKGGWKSVVDVEIAVAEYVDWINHRRLHGEIGLIPPAEFEADH